MADDQLDDFIDALKLNLEEINTQPNEIKQVYEHPPEKLDDFPCAVLYFVSGGVNYGAASPAVIVHRVHVDLHVMRAMLPHDEKVVRPFILLVIKKIAANLKMEATCDHCVVLSYEYGRIGYGSSIGRQETMGIRFILEVKIKHSGFTISA